jgi:hypothetical protein
MTDFGYSYGSGFGLAAEQIERELTNFGSSLTNSLSSLDFAAMVPTYGNFCGPGWTNGVRNDPNAQRVSSRGALDALCDLHDTKYGQAENPWDIVRADVQLIAGTWGLLANPGNLTTTSGLYAIGMAEVFRTKLTLWDVPRAILNDIFTPEVDLSPKPAIAPSPVAQQKAEQHELRAAPANAPSPQPGPHAPVGDWQHSPSVRAASAPSPKPGPHAPVGDWHHSPSARAASAPSPQPGPHTPVGDWNHPASPASAPKASSSPGFGPGSMAAGRAVDRNSMPDYAGGGRSTSSGDGGHGSTPSSNPGSGASQSYGGSVGADPGGPNWDNEGKPSANDPTTDHSGGGHMVAPVLLDLCGNGLSIDPLSSSSKFVEVDGDGLQHRTAWAGDGNGVLVLDLNGDGKITEEREFAFTQWDATADGDLDALRKVFDSNSNGKLDAGDARWQEFKVDVNGQLVSLSSLGIASIDLKPSGSGQNFADGSAITGTTTFTRTDGTTGLVGDAVMPAETAGYRIKRNKVTNADQSTTETVAGFNRDGSIAFTNQITASADGKRVLTRFDDNGDGVFDRSQSNDLVVSTDGTRTRTVSSFNGDGSLRDKTVSATSADRRTVTTTLDRNGYGVIDERQVFVRNADGSSVTTVEELSKSGKLLKKVVTTASADGLSKTVATDPTGSGVFDRTLRETTIVNADQSRTRSGSGKPRRHFTWQDGDHHQRQWPGGIDIVGP